MSQLVPLLMNFVEQQARPHVQEKVTEQLNSTRTDLKNDLPNTIINFLSGNDGNNEGGNSMVSQILSKLGPNFPNRLRSVTDTTVDTASEGMDTLLTNGVLSIAKSVLSKNAPEGAEGQGQDVGGLNFAFLKSGKEGMVNTTMAASKPVIKQVSDNMGNKLSSSIPAAIGGVIQQLIDENSTANGALGMAAGLMSKFMGSNNAPGNTTPPNDGGTEEDIQRTGGHTGRIQQLLQNLLAPKILLLLQPYLQKFEAQMAETLENDLRTKVFSPEYIKQTVLAMLTGAGGQGGSGAGAILGGVMNSFLKKNSDNNNSQQNSEGGDKNTKQALGALGDLASSFLKNRK
ncbi:hypothetical protein BX616_001979 [Lobosporangium transversale]|uniref:DUF937 domain-containing protein n=1 Tax=Lobosporangium transversale TaxID=64571 RepID=A0A1Y2GGW5_9FUNG|nr:hypothetical protein BCR41DRAFT_387941 [Lobosporangium transversale]KAF9902314.1 hypothetical protein BX616_001979 [Lobosporangium transversale]ORZ10597.1 hypothetical protein BCR41DRAFT_387941 [Lobosporangium transversale]|eukprot:XP_021879318.1 hypothetical protein BCR41DRAFT_387941 [Lobosporangium transversale]